jgi:hypothetical protein
MIIAAKAAAASGESKLAYQWVVAGDNGHLLTSTSTTASSWTARTSSFGTSNIWSVTANGKTAYVAVGSDNKLASSPDGITWTQRTSPLTSGTYQFVVFANGYFVAGGTVGKIIYSTDGTTWTEGKNFASSINSISWSGTTWGVAFTTGFETGTDLSTGGTWTARTTTITGSIVQAYYSTNPAIWVAGQDTGTTGALASSSDAITWTARTSADSTNQASRSKWDNKAGTIVMTNDWNTDFVQYSTNGTTWTAATTARTGDTMFNVATDDLGTFLVVSYDNIYDWYGQTSTDGITWTNRGMILDIPGVNRIPRAVCHSSGIPIAR